MPLPVVCPACNSKFNVPDKYAGKRGKCPECASVFRAPTTEELLSVAGVSTGASPEPPPVETDVIPVGIAIEPEAAPPFAFDNAAAPPTPAFISEGGLVPSRSPAARSNRAQPKPKLSPVLLGGIAGGVLLAVGVVAAIVWATSGNSAKIEVAAGKTKKQNKALVNRAGEDNLESSDAANTAGASNSAAPRDDRRHVPRDLPEKKPGDDFGALPEFEKPESVVPPPTVPVPAFVPEVKTLSAESIRRALEECENISWKPADQEQYARLQELARLVTLAASADEISALSAEDRTAISAAAQEVLEKLAGAAWISDADIGAVNRLAAESFKESEVGTFAYGTVVGSIPSLPQLGSRNLLIFELGGTMETVVVPVNTPLEDSPKGTRWIIMGRRNPRAGLNLTMVTGDVERQVKPAIVNCVHLVGEPKREL